jgi:carbonic anhydrase/acetyltransferase-like protein (isoleucine patch superfamily)
MTTVSTLVQAQSQIVTPDNQVVSIQSVSGNVNLFIGQSTSAVIGGTYNTFVGSQSGQGNKSGSYNTYLGYKAGAPNTVGNNNTFVGYESGKLNTDGSDNVFIGFNAGSGSQRGSRNLIIGPNAGFDAIGGGDNTLIGSNAIGVGAGLSNATAIGANARVLSSNAMVLGNNVNVGIGTSAPQNRLELTAGVDGRSGLRLTNMTASSPTSIGTTGKFLTVSDKGDVLLGNQLSAVATRVQPASESQWADYVFAPTYQPQSLAEVEQYVRKNRHLPGIPSASEMVKEGTDLLTLLATLVQKNEELTLHMIEQQKRIEKLEKEASERKK